MGDKGWFFRTRRGLPAELAEAQQRVEAIARGHGLDFCDILYEVCDY